MKNTSLLLGLGFLILSIIPLYGQENRNNQKIDGYKGIWFTLGQFSEYGDKYSGGLGTYTAKHIPLAIYAPEVDKTFFVYGGTTGEKDRYLLCMIGCYDHQTATVTKPTVVYDKEGVNDPHDNPSLAIDSNGYLWIFVSGRGTGRKGLKYQSEKPFDISTFKQITKEMMNYAQPKYVQGKGFLNLFTKYDGIRLLYFETSPDGVSWTEDKLLAAIKREGDKNGGHYQISNQLDEKIVFFFNWHPNGNVDLRTNIYYLQTMDFGKTWTNVQGKEIQIPVTTVDSPALIKEFFSRKINVYIKDVTFDENGNPIALYVSGKGHEPGPANGPREWAIIYWNGNEWENHKVTNSDHNYDTGCLWVTPEKWTVIGPTIDRPQQWAAGGELALWESTDKGKTWKMIKQITNNSPRNHNYVRRVVNGKDPFKYFWADGNPNGMSQSKLYFGDSHGNTWQLPYKMSSENSKPNPVNPLQ
jgi:hypothetical protein